MLGLLYKNFVVTKSYVLLLLPACAVMALFLGESFGEVEYRGTMILMICAVYVPFCCLMDLTRKDSEYHGAVALVGATPLPRAAMVASTYLYAFIMYGLAWLIFSVEALFVPALSGVSPLAAAAVFFVLCVLVGILLPLHYLLGFDRTRLIYVGVILATPFLIARLGGSTDLPAQLQADDPLMTALFWGGGCAVLAVSLLLSVRAFSRAELA